MPRLFKQIDHTVSRDVQISGGEPLARSPAELLRILLHCRQNRKTVELQTNGTLLDSFNARGLRGLVGLVDFFNVNFPAHTAGLDRKITGAPDAFGRRVRGVRRLLRAGAVVRLNHVLCALNYRYSEDFVRFAHARLPGFSWIQFSYCKGMGRAQDNAAVLPRFQDAAPYLLRACRRCERIGIPFDVDHIPVCFVADYKEHHADYRKMLAGAPGAHLREKQHVRKCAACRMRRWCPGPRRDYIDVYGGL